jgi:photosystem II stability/assembly factor-like uncharacterized protein
MKIGMFFFLSLWMLTASGSYCQWVKVGDGTIGNYDVQYGGSLSFKSGIIWAGIRDLWKSADSGTTWTKTNLNIGNAFITDINFFDQNNGVVAVYTQGVFLTRDAGNSWTEILSRTDCLGVAFNRTKDEILVADRDNLAGRASYTSDGGISWKTQVIEPNSNSGAYHLVAGSNGRAYILSRTFQQGSHIFESTDFGLSWVQHAGDVDLDSYSLAIDSCHPKQIYIGNEEFNQINNGFSEIFSSTDDGDSWTSTIQKPPKFFTSVCGTSQNAVFAATSGSGIYRSTDGGKNWIPIGGPSSHCDSRLMTIVSDNIIFAADNNGTIWRTTNSGGFPIPTNNASAVQFTLSTLGHVTEDTLGALISLPIYIKTSGAMPAFDMVVHYPSSQLRYIRSITLSNKTIDITGGSWPGRSAIHFDAADLAARKDSLIGYSIFKQLPGDTDCAHIVMDSATEIVVQPCALTTTIVAPSTEGIIGAPKTPDFAFSISSARVINDSLGISVYLPIFLKCSTAMPSFDMVIDYPTYSLTYLRGISYSGKSIDISGQQWPGRAKVHFDAADLAGRKDSLIGYAVFHWYPFEYACSYITFDSMSVSMAENLCTSKAKVSDTATDGIIGSYISCGLSGVDNVNSQVISLETNRPNPFSHKTAFTFSIAEYSNVRLSLYDELGKEVARIIDGDMSSGHYTKDFDGSNLPIGNYIARLESNGKPLSRRVVIER